jgi:hypothetical protein
MGAKDFEVFRTVGKLAVGFESFFGVILTDILAVFTDSQPPLPHIKNCRCLLLLLLHTTSPHTAST